MHRPYGLQGSLKRRYKHPSPTSINGYHTAKKLLSQSPAKRPTFAFTHESGYTLGFAQRIAHSGSHGETRGVLGEGGIITLGAFRTFTNIPGPGIRTAYFAALEAWSGVLPKNAGSLGTAMRLCVSLFRGVAAPLGCVIFFCFCQNCGLHTMCSVLSACARRGVVSPLLVCSACCRNSRSPLVKTTNLSFSEVGWASLIPAAQNVLDR